MTEHLNRLFSSYGLVDATKISKEEQSVDLMVWNLNVPLVIVYRAVDKLVDVAAEGNVPKIQDQIFTIDVEMIRKN